MKLRTLAVPALLALLVVPAFAQKGGPQKGGMNGKSMGKPMGKSMMDKKSFSGIVKGMPVGKKFMMGSKMGSYTVDASKAKVRMMGRFMSASDLKGGDMVMVMGMMNGHDIMADAVTVTHRAGMKGKPTMKKAPMGAPGKPMKPGMPKKG